LVIVTAGAMAAATLLGAAGSLVFLERDPMFNDDKAITSFLTSPPATLTVPTDVNMPQEHGGHALRPTDLPVVIAKDALRFPLSGFMIPLPPDRTHGVAAKYKQSGTSNDLYIQPLGQVLTWAFDKVTEAAPVKGVDPGHTGLILLADGDTPYRLIVEVAYTAGRAGWSRLSLAARDGQQVTGFDVGDLNVPSRHEVPRKQVLGLTLTLTSGGIAMKAAGGNMAPGCEEVGGGIAIGKLGDDYDYAALRKCATRLHDSSPDYAGETTVTIAANPNVPLQAVVNAAQAVSKTQEGADLLPDLRLGVVR
jgi:biopolymer transport protein ExbD